MSDGYRNNFRKSRPQLYENPEQFVTRLKSYLDKWISLSHADELAIGIKELFIREQFINACPKDLAIHLRERELPNLEELMLAAGRYLVAHNQKFHFTSTSCLISVPSGAVGHDDIQSHEEVQKAAIQCFLCKRFGHRASECKSRIKTQCYICGKLGHEAKRCWLVRRGMDRNTKTTYKAAAGEDKSKDEHSLQHGGRTSDSKDVSAGCL